MKPAKPAPITTSRPDEVPGPVAPQHPVIGIYGWVCPRCGRGNAPHVSTCPCLPLTPNPFGPTVTC
jgi:hypothetical protein